jgi:predicted outer membrane repeat protein
VELCDSRRNDCSNTNWTVASETGTAVHTSPTGVLTRVGALLQGREGAPASYTVPAGTLALCHGTYYTQLSVTGSSAVAIVGVEGAGATTLNASRAGAVISTQANTNLTVSGVTISGGWQTFPNPGGNGGGISARGALVVRDSVFIGNGAVEGGAIYAEREATLSRLRIESSTGSAVRTHGDALLVDVDFINNLGRGFVPQGRFTTVRGGRFVGTRDVALTIDTSECILEVEGTTFTDHRSHTVAFVACPEATLDDVRIVDNVESTIVLHVRGGELTLRDSTIHGNGGRVHVQASRLDCEDSSITANGGITFGGVQVSADGTFFSRACDFGTSPADNNRPADVRVLVPSTSNFVDYHFGNNATFSCGLGSCIP